MAQNRLEYLRCPTRVAPFRNSSPRRARQLGAPPAAVATVAVTAAAAATAAVTAAVTAVDLVEEGSILLCLRRGANTHLVPVRRLRQQLYPGREQIPVL